MKKLKKPCPHTETYPDMLAWEERCMKCGEWVRCIEQQEGIDRLNNTLFRGVLS